MKCPDPIDVVGGCDSAMEWFGIDVECSESDHQRRPWDLVPVNNSYGMDDYYEVCGPVAEAIAIVREEC